MGRYRIKERVRCLANFMLIRFCSASECISAWTEWEAGFKQRVTCSNKPSLDMVEEPPTHIPNVTSVCTLVTVSDTQLENGPRSHNENSPKMSLLVLRIESGPPNLHELAWRVKRRLKDNSSRSYQQRWMLLKRNRQQSIQERERKIIQPWSVGEWRTGRQGGEKFRERFERREPAESFLMSCAKSPAFIRLLPVRWVSVLR